MKIYKILPKLTVLTILATLSLTSCSLLRPTVVNSDTSKEMSQIIDYKHVHDTVIFRDSVIIHAVGDTIFAEKWHVKYISKSVLDTIRTTDTVILTKVETKMIEPPKKPLKDKIKEIFIIGIISIILFLLIKFIIKTLWKQ